jgi:hypothetical protein
MSHRVETDDGASPPADPAGVETIEAYETDGGVVLYDAENPLAWVETTLSVRLDEQQ